jgi:hypothetical protein
MFYSQTNDKRIWKNKKTDHICFSDFIGAKELEKLLAGKPSCPRTRSRAKNGRNRIPSSIKAKKFFGQKRRL